MPNAWFYYVFPLVLSAVFVIAGVTILRRAVRANQNPEDCKSKPAPGCFGVLILLVGSVIGLAILLTSPTPWARKEMFNHIFRTPPDQINQFVIVAGKPGEYKSLTQSEVIIDDPARIRRIAAILSSGREVSPNHPRTLWSTKVKMDTRSGSYHFRVIATESGDSNGTLVNVATRPGGGGWNLGDVRADGLEKILEEAVKAVGAH